MLLQRLAAFFHDVEMHTLWVLAAKTVMAFTLPPSVSEPDAAANAGAAALMETAEMAREAGIDALEHTLSHAPSAVVASIAAKALQVLAAQSDALSSHLVTQLGNWPIDERTILRALTLHDPNVLHQLLFHAAVRVRSRSFHRSLKCLGRKLSLLLRAIVALQVPASGDAATQRRTERARETAVAVLTAIVITSDHQASVCLEILPLVESGTFLCGPLLRFFRGCRQADSRWRLKEGLYMQLLQLQLTHPSCLDIAVLLHVRSNTTHP